MGIFHSWDSPQARRIVWGPPQRSASKIGPTAATSTAAPLPEPCGPTEKIQSRSDGIWLGLAGLQRLPTCCRCTGGCCRCRGLSLCQKAANFIIGGKLSQDGSVSQHTPGKEEREELWIWGRLESTHGDWLFQVRSFDQQLSHPLVTFQEAESQDQHLHFTQATRWLRGADLKWSSITKSQDILRLLKDTINWHPLVCMWNLYVKKNVTRVSPPWREKVTHHTPR